MKKPSSAEKYGGKYKDYQLDWDSLGITLLLTIVLYGWFIILYISIGQNRQLMHVEPGYPFVRTTVETRMRVDSPVEPVLFNPRISPCDSLALHATGAWAGEGERLSAHANTRSQRKLADAAAIVATRAGEGRDFMSSCIRSALGVDASSNLAFINQTLFSLIPGGNRTDEYSNGYALGTATMFGGEPIVRFLSITDPRPQKDSLLEWGVGAMAREFLYNDADSVRQYVNASCTALHRIGLRNISQEDCVSDSNEFIMWLLDMVDAYGGTDIRSYQYIRFNMTADVRTRREMADLLGLDFIEGFLDGVLSQFEMYREFLLGFDFEIPPLKTMLHWTRRMPFLQQLVQKMAAVPFETNLRRIRMLLMLHGMDYTTAILHPRRPSDDFLQSSALPKWVLTAPPEEQNSMYMREELTQMMQPKITERCMWLMREHLPAHVEVAYREATVTPARQTMLRHVFVNVTLALLEKVHRLSLPRSERISFSNRLQALRFSIGTPETQQIPLHVETNAPLVEFAFAARRAKLVDNLFYGATRQRVVHPRNELVYYDQATHTVVASATLAQQPYMSEAWSSSALYGMPGVLIAREVLRGLDFYPNETACVAEQYSRHATPRHSNPVAGELFAEEARLDVGGLQLALTALEGTMGGMIGTAEMREFLEAYAQMGANGHDAKQERIHMHGKNIAPPLTREDGAMRNLVDGQNRHVMTRIYNCPVNSRMNPAQKCTII